MQHFRLGVLRQSVEADQHASRSPACSRMARKCSKTINTAWSMTFSCCEACSFLLGLVPFQDKRGEKAHSSVARKCLRFGTQWCMLRACCWITNICAPSFARPVTRLVQLRRGRTGTDSRTATSQRCCAGEENKWSAGVGTGLPPGDDVCAAGGFRMSRASREQAVQVGDTVAYSRRFLQSIACFTGNMPQARGKVTALTTYERTDTSLTFWDSPNASGEVSMKYPRVTQNFQLFLVAKGKAVYQINWAATYVFGKSPVWVVSAGFVPTTLPTFLDNPKGSLSQGKAIHSLDSAESHKKRRHTPLAINSPQSSPFRR